MIQTNFRPFQPKMVSVRVYCIQKLFVCPGRFFIGHVKWAVWQVLVNTVITSETVVKMRASLIALH